MLKFKIHKIRWCKFNKLQDRARILQLLEWLVEASYLIMFLGSSRIKVVLMELKANTLRDPVAPKECRIKTRMLWTKTLSIDKTTVLWTKVGWCITQCMEVEVQEYPCHKINKYYILLDRWTESRPTKIYRVELVPKDQCQTEALSILTIPFTSRLRIRPESLEAWLDIKQELIPCQQLVQIHTIKLIKNSSNKRVKSLTQWWKYKVSSLDKISAKRDQVQRFQLRKSNRFKTWRVEW